ncbi:protease pro-enzyme activation domain-containing protein [Kitasatospora sp. NPDC059571]|uniref:S53 family peptidase n=1 Tax=Kitasatospora sp. NPDC059571 TaxID=3346871 RepID=UPI003697CB33
MTAALVAGAGLPTIATAQAESIAPKRLGSAPVVPKGAVKTAAPADSTQLDLSVTLQPKDQAALSTFVGAVSNPSSPLYKHYLNTGEFGQRFGADPATVASVRAALTAAGLHPGEVGANGLTIPVRATVAEAKKAFSTDFAGYKLADGSAAYANTQAPAVRGDLAGKIAGVVGLDTTATYKPHSVVKPKATFSAAVNGSEQARNIGASPALCSTWKNIMTGAGYTDGTDYYSSGELAKAYELNGLADGASGSTVAVLSLENYDSNAVSAYQSCNGTKASVSNIPVGSFVPGAPNVDAGEGGETALDVETIASLAPGSSILVYQGANTGQGVIDTYQKIVNDNRAKVVSISWGRCEAERDSGREATMNVILQQAAAQGQSVLAASGDAGSTDCRGSGLGNDTLLNTDSPASQPYATGVGGTSHSGLGAVSAGSISVWNNGYGFGGGGGGVDTRWALNDADFAWNKNKATEYSNLCGAVSGQTCRQVPDVSALADPDHGYLVFTDVSNGSVHGAVIGGTSGAAPLWAALIADANASTACAANGPLGYLNPALHALAGNTSVFNDVTSGTNDVASVGHYSAASGYDLASGLGSPKGKSMIAALCKALPSQPAGTFNPVSPSRVLDTRNGTGAPTGKVASRGTLPLQVTGRGGVPASNVTSVVLNVTVTGANGAGYLTAWPSGKAQPDSSNLNWTAGRDVPNLVTVPVGADGKVNLFNGSWNTSVDLVADVFGYYSADSNGSTLTPAGPTRLLDTRNGTGLPGNVAAKLGSKQTMSLAIPGSGVTAVVLNTTVTKTNDPGYLTVFPSGQAKPASSNLNWVKGQTVPNLVIVPVGADGKVSFYNNAASPIDLLADVFGYFTTDASGGKFHNAGPKRLMDTRSGLGAPAPAALGNSQIVHLSLNDGGALSGATSVVLNVTVTGTTAAGYLNAWPGYTTRPLSSNLNWDAPGQTIANLVTVPVQNGAVDLAVNTSAHVIVDLFGYYSAN